jgi:glycosyltransferase involved in cell wall biosynthesis
LINILHIFPGPIYDIESFLKTKFEYLSEFSSGTIITTFSHNNSFICGNYKIISIGLKGRSSIFNSYKLLRTAVKEAGSLRASAGLDLVVCYDPLKAGIIGLIIKIINNCKLLVEVNGVFSSSALYQSGGIVTKLKKYIYPKIQQNILQRADGVKCLLKGQLKGFQIPDKVVLRHFFDFTDIPTTPYQISDTRTVMTIGYPSYIKGFDLLILAFNSLQQFFPEWKLVIIGWFTKQETDEFSAFIGTNSQIEIRKPIQFSEIPEVIDSCDIFVLASRTEAMGRVLIETMARSKARTGARIDGIPTVINDDIDGLLFEANNIEDLSIKLKILIGSESERCRLAMNGYARYITEFTIQNYCKHVEALYASVMSCE